MGGGTQRIAGAMQPTEVMIAVPDHHLTEDDELNETWHTLKYGPIPDLFDAMHEHKKIDKIDFPNDGIILRGVFPVSVERTAIWEGRVFTCKIDYFEVTDEEKFQRSYQSQL